MRKFIPILVSLMPLIGTTHAADLGQSPSTEILSAIELVASRFYSGKTLKQVYDDSLDHPQSVHIATCGDYAMGMGVGDDHLAGAADLAAFVVLMRAELKGDAELQTAAASFLQRLEAMAVDELDETRGRVHREYQNFYQTKMDLLNELATTLNKRISAEHYVVDEGCGGGEIHVRLITRPASAKVYVIKLFDYTLCEVRHIDPMDKEACFGWQLNATEVLDMSGWYRYQAIWGDGKVTDGRFSVTKQLFMQNIDQDKPLVLTLSQ